MTTRIMITPRVKLAREAVTTLDVVSNKAWSMSNLKGEYLQINELFLVLKNVPFYEKKISHLRTGPQPISIAEQAAKAPTTIP